MVNRCGSIALVLGSDDRYAFAAAVVLHESFRRLVRSPVTEVVFVCNNVSQVNRDRIANVVRRAAIDIRFVEVPQEELLSLPTSRHITVASYLRLFAGRYVSPGVERAVYLDADLLVRADLAELVTVDLQGRTLGACWDYVRPERVWTGAAANGGRGGSDSEPEAYFNAGLLVIDVERWHKLDVEKRAIAFVAAHSELVMAAHDQDLLNVMLVGDWTPLEPAWNVCNELFFIHGSPPHPFRSALLERRAELTAEAKIVHFTGHPKPWQYWCMNPYAMAWAVAYLRSGWRSPIVRLAWFSQWWIKRMLFLLRGCLLGTLPRDLRTDDVTMSPAGPAPAAQE